MTNKTVMVPVELAENLDQIKEARNMAMNIAAYGDQHGEAGHVAQLLDWLVSAIEAAPEQEAEPVAWAVLNYDGKLRGQVSTNKQIAESWLSNCSENLLTLVPLYAAPPAAQQAKADCNWSYDQDDELWYSGCGHSWVNEDNPDFPGCKFCYNCGGVVTITVEYEPPEQAE